MPDIAASLRADQIAARKAHDKDRTLLLGTVLAALKNRELDSSEPLTDEQAIEVIQKQVKQRLDSVDQYTKANRADLADVEQAEIDLLKAYLPAQADPAEIKAAADAAVAAGAADLGRLMGTLMAQFKGKADGKVVNRIAREALGQG